MDSLIPGLLIALVTLMGTFSTNCLQTYFANKRTAYREAYDTFYLPFVTLLYQSEVWWLNYSDLPKDKQVRFCKLIMENIRYMDNSVLDGVDVLYGHILGVLYGEITGNYGITTPARLNEVFSDFVEATLKRADWLARKLHQPRLSRHALSLYQESAGRRERAFRQSNDCSGSDTPDAGQDQPRLDQRQQD